MNSTEDAQGDAARTADEYANQMRALKGNIRDVMAEAGKEGMTDLTDTLIEFNEWGTSGGYDNITMFLSDVASLAADAAKGVAILTQTFGDLYGTVVSEGPMPEAMGTSGTMPGGNISEFVGFSDEQMTEIYRQFGYNEDEIAAKLEHRRQLIEEQNDEIDDQIDKTNQLVNATSSIPDWAGRSDYIRGRMAETGTTTLNDMMSLGSSTPETHDNVVTSTRTIEQSAGGSISTSLLDVSRSGFNTVSQKLDRVVDAVNNISINVSTGSRRSGTSSSDVLANMKENLIKPPIDPRI
jgi:DNA-binding transcriptional MerR regulator